ncbi:MAG: hypothetical protein IKZ16_00950 [Clostridia bacterium]|nr:hypothetical protein [Clostridia bacterium]
MNKEQFFEAIGEIDDRILEKFRVMDLRLAQKRATKRRAWRRLAVAACIALCFAGLVPVGMWAMVILPLIFTPQEYPPSMPELSIEVRSMQEFEKMREMIDCEDEQALEEYLQGLGGYAVDSRQDLIDFVALAESMPCAWIIDGEVTYMSHTIHTPSTAGVFSASIRAENGDEVSCYMHLDTTDPGASLAAVKAQMGKENLLDSPLSTPDGRLTLHFEIRQPSGRADRITWWGELDGMVVEIRYCVSNADTVDTRQLLANLVVSELLPPADPYPKYAWSDTKFGAFVQRPEYAVTGVSDSPGMSTGMVEQVWSDKEYQDPDAPQTITLTVQGVEYELAYEKSRTASAAWQARHVYQDDSGRVQAWIDCETGECMRFSNYNEMFETDEKGSQRQIAQDVLAQVVSDPQAYREQEPEKFPDGTVIFSYTRYVGEYPSCDKISIMIDPYGNVINNSLGYVGAMRNAQPIPDEVISYVETSILAYYAQGQDASYEIKRVVIAPDGRMALECSASYYTESDGQRWEHGVWLTVFLTEPIK